MADVLFFRHPFLVRSNGIGERDGSRATHALPPNTTLRRRVGVSGGLRRGSIYRGYRGKSAPAPPQQLHPFIALSCAVWMPRLEFVRIEQETHNARVGQHVLNDLYGSVDQLWFQFRLPTL
jgi:hypothetical protein